VGAAMCYALCGAWERGMCLCECVRAPGMCVCVCVCVRVCVLALDSLARSLAPVHVRVLSLYVFMFSRCMRVCYLAVGA